MARIDNLENFVTDIAGAIRAKTGTTSKIPCADFDTEILSIPTDGGGGGGETPPCSDTWVRPKEWLPYPDFNTEFDEIYLLLNIYHTTKNPIGFKLTGYDTNSKYTYNLGYQGANDIENPFSQGVYTFVSWDDIPDTNKITSDVKQVWVHIKSAKGNIKGIDLKSPFPTAPNSVTIKTYPIIEYYAQCERMYELKVGTSDPTTSPVFCSELISFIHKGELQDDRDTYLIDFLFAYLVNLENLELNLGKMTRCGKMCQNCLSLTTVKLQSKSIQNFNRSFSGCVNLKVMPTLDLDNAKDIEYMFENTGITHIPNLMFTEATLVDALFYNCHKLVTVGKLEFPKLTRTNYNFLARGTESLISIDNIIINNMQNGTLFDDNDSCLRSVKLSSYQGATTSAGCLKLPSKGNLMSGEALNALFESIQTVTLPYNIITISGCMGKDDCDITIAQQKGYTIVR